MRIAVSIWSDIACPWCFVGKSRFESALKRLAKDNIAADVQVRWRAFELDPRQREITDTPYVERLAAKYNRSIAEAQQMLDTMSDAIVAAGGECDFDKLIPANTFDAHRLIQWSGTSDTPGAQQRLTDALMRGYLGRGLDLSSPTEMLEVVSNVGLDAAKAAAVLDSDEFAETVRADEQEAHRNGIQGVPFFVIGRYGVSGAQEVSTFVDVIRQSLASYE